MAMAGFIVVILIPTWPAVILGSVLFLSWTAISLPASMGLVASVLPKDKRTMGVSMHSMVRRVPMALGPIIGGVFIGVWGERTGVRLAFVAALAMAVVALVMQQKLIVDDRGSASGDGVPGLTKNPIKALRLLSPNLKNLLVSDILVRFCEQIPYAFVVVWAMKVITSPISAVQFGFLTAIEMVVAMLIYIPVAYLADRGTKKPFVAITFVFFTLFPLALLFSHSFAWLVGAFILRGFKEFGEPTRKALIMDLAPEGRKAATFGLYYLLRDTVVSVAAFGGAFLWMISPATNFLAAFACGVAGTGWFLVKGTDLTAERLV
jgi:MFS family permease